MLHPNLTVVGAHLGSMEVDVVQIAERFDKVPELRRRYRGPRELIMM